MEFEFLNHQYKFLNMQETYCALIGGVGSGKTYSGSAWILEQASQYPKSMGGIFANTYKQLTNSTLTGLFKFLESANIPFNYNQHKAILTINESKILCMSSENYDVLRGVELGYAWLDEASFMEEGFWTVLVGRIRDKRGPLKVRLTTTPRGFNWVYDYFQGEKKTSSYNIVHASIKDNPYLPESYIQALYQQYDQRLIEQELEGKFVNIYQGRIYYAFDRDKNIKTITRDKRQPTWVFMDFNINPMTATIANVYKEHIEVFDEAFIMSSNTEEMGKYILDKYGACNIIPDATGRAIKTSSGGLSDHEILRRLGHKVYDTRSPSRIDRYNTMNSLLEKKRILIDPSCKKIINDLERVSYKEGTNLPDTSDSLLTHLSDGLGYGAFYFFPLLPNRTVKVSQYV